MRERLLSTKNVVLMGMLGGLSAVLMMFEIPLTFLAPPFYGLDFSEVPVLVGTFAMGSLAGAVIEVVKILIKLLLKPTSTAFVGEFANVVIGWSLVIPAGVIYRMKRTKKGALLGMTVGTLLMTVAGVVVNAVVMLPFYGTFMGLGIDKIIAMGAAVNPAVGSIWSFAIICVGPFNLVKGAVVSLITDLVYKRVSRLIHSVGAKRA